MQEKRKEETFLWKNEKWKTLKNQIMKKWTKNEKMKKEKKQEKRQKTGEKKQEKKEKRAQRGLPPEMT